MVTDNRIFDFNVTFDIKRSFAYTPNEVAGVRCKQLPDGGVKYMSDVQLLLNEERLRDTLGIDTFKKWLQHFQISASSTGVDTSKYTDAQLMQFIKSRYIQTPSELKAWSSYLNSCADDVIQQYNDEVLRQQAAQEAEIAAQQSSQSSAGQDS